MLRLCIAVCHACSRCVRRRWPNVDAARRRAPGGSGLLEQPHGQRRRQVTGPWQRSRREAPALAPGPPRASQELTLLGHYLSFSCSVLERRRKDGLEPEARAVVIISTALAASSPVQPSVHCGKCAHSINRPTAQYRGQVAPAARRVPGGFQAAARQPQL